MNIRREKYKFKDMSRKTPLEVSPEASTAKKKLSTLSLKNHQKSSLSASRVNSVIYDMDDSSQSDTPRYYFSTEIPERYNETYINAIPKDPNWLYVYWEFSDETARMMDSNLEKTGSKLVLRLKETDVAETFEGIIPYQVEIDDLSKGQYIHIPEYSGELQIECGYFSKKDGFTPVIQSEPVTIPWLDTAGQAFDIFASDEERKNSLFVTTNEPQLQSSGITQPDYFNSQTFASY